MKNLLVSRNPNSFWGNYILLVLLSCWLLTHDDVIPNWVELRVCANNLMMKYEGNLVILMIPILYFK